MFADRVCPGVEWAIDQGIPVLYVPPSGHPDRASWDMGLAAGLQQAEADVVVLAGFLRILGPNTLAAFRGRIVNVHPSLLPSFPGLHAIDDALAARVAVTGVTVHLVDETLDGGPIVAQEAVAGAAIGRPRDRWALASRPWSIGCCRGSWRMAAAGTLGIDAAGHLTFDRTRSARIPVPQACAAVDVRQGRPRGPRRGPRCARASSWSRPAARPPRCATRDWPSPTCPP